MPDDYTQYNAVLAEVGRSDPAMALEFAGQLANEKGRAYAQTIYISALRGLAYTGQYQKAAELIASTRLPQGDVEHDMSGFLAGEWGRFEPAEARLWASSL